MRITLNTITPPVTYPVESSEAMTWLKWDPSNLSESVLIDELIATATSLVEYYTARAIITQTLEMQLIPEVKSTMLGGQRLAGYESLPQIFKLYRPPLQSVTSIKAIELDGTEHLIPSTNYTYDAKSLVGRIKLNYDTAWDYYDEGSYVIRYIAGYGTTIDKVPPQIKHAIRLITSQLYGNREKGIASLTLEQQSELDLVLQELVITHHDLE